MAEAITYPPIICSDWGPEKSLKSSLGLTFPKPLVHFDFDLGFERAMYRFCKEGTQPEPIMSEQVMKDGVVIEPSSNIGWTIHAEDGDITSYRFPTPFNLNIRPNQPLKGFRETWNNFLERYHKALTSPEVRTVMVDTATQAWQICHQGYLQEKQEQQILNAGLQLNQAVPGSLKLREKLIPIEYAEPNGRMRAVEQAPKAYAKNGFFCHYQADTYATRMGAQGPEEYKTGEKELDGFRHTNNLSDIVLQMKVLRRKEGDPPTEVIVPSAKVVVCGLTLNMVGLELENPTYLSIMRAVEMFRR